MDEKKIDNIDWRKTCSNNKEMVNENQIFDDATHFGEKICKFVSVRVNNSNKCQCCQCSHPLGIKGYNTAHNFHWTENET